MEASGRRPWLRWAILIGVVYLIVGIVFGEFAGHAESDQARVLWRRAAWVVSAAVYGAQIGYEHFRLRHSPRSIAIHAAVAVAVGAFALAVAALVHSWQAPSDSIHLLYFALAIWPIMAALPAYLVALAASGLLARHSRTA